MTTIYIYVCVKIKTLIQTLLDVSWSGVWGTHSDGCKFAGAGMFRVNSFTLLYFPLA